MKAEVKVGCGCVWTHTHERECFEPRREKKSAVCCDYTAPLCPTINHPDYLGQP